MSDLLRQALADRLQSPPPYPAGRFDGRGIVICAGGPRYFVFAWVLISILRQVHRTELPIQVWHLGQREMSEEMRGLLEAMQVEVVDAETVIARFPARIPGGWPLKPYAILHSRFREVLYLDADTLPFADPRPMFDWPQYRDAGLLLWPDIVDLRAESPIWQAVGLQPRISTSAEAGVLLVDKQAAWPVLDIALLLNQHIDEVYNAVYGDKDTFLVASLLCGHEPAVLPHRPFIFDVDLVQRGFDGEPLVQHRTGSKWNPAGPNRPLAQASLMPACNAALAELRERWSGGVFHAPPRSVRAEREVERLIALRLFHYQFEGSDERPMELLPAGRVGKGRGDLEQHWAVIERDGVLVLQFYSQTRLTIEMTQGVDQSWSGRGVAGLLLWAHMRDDAAWQSWPQAGERGGPSSADWVANLIDVKLFAPGFDHERAQQLQAALTLLNERFNDVPEQVETRLAAIAVPERWRTSLVEMCGGLADSRGKRIALAARAPYPVSINWSHYDRIL